jgi:hypothetical protein
LQTDAADIEDPFDLGIVLPAPSFPEAICRMKKAISMPVGQAVTRGAS